VLNREQVGMKNSKQKCYCFYRKNYELAVAIGEELWISGNRLENGKFVGDIDFESVSKKW